MLESGSGLAPVASLPCCFHRDASRSERLMKFEGFGLTDLRDELDIADVVMEQRSARCLLRVNLRIPPTRYSTAGLIFNSGNAFDRVAPPIGATTVFLSEGARRCT